MKSWISRVIVGMFLAATVVAVSPAAEAGSLASETLETVVTASGIADLVLERGPGIEIDG